MLCQKFLLVGSLITSVSGISSLDPCSHLPDATYVNRKCFARYTTELAFGDAQVQCQQQLGGGTLAEPRTSVEMDALYKFIGNDTAAYYLGLSDRDTENVFLWLSTNETATSPAWMDNQPDNVGNEDCAVLLSPRGLNDQPCDWLNPYICQQDAINPCDEFLPKGEYFDGKCFQLNQIAKNWQDSQDYCDSYKAILAEPKTQEMSDYLKGMANRTYDQTALTHVRLGGLDQMNGSWTWFTSSDVFDFADWGNDPFGEQQHYVAMASVYQWKWEAVDDTSMPFICQRDIGEPCESHFPDAVYSVGQCWKFVDTAMTWDDAQAACNKQDAFLAEPKTQELNDALIRLIHSVKKVDVWIGGSDQETEGTFKWVTSGDEFSFLNWDETNPNNGGTAGEDHVNLNNQQSWVDSVKTRTIRFVCQKEYQPNAAQSYVVTFPFSSDDANQGILHVTSGLSTRPVYLRINISEDEQIRASVAWSDSFVYTMDPTKLTNGDNHKAVHMNSTDSVTVVLLVKRRKSLGSSLVYPTMTATSRAYFVPSPTIDEVQDYSVAILAFSSVMLDHSTNITIYPKQDQENGFGVSYGDTNFWSKGDAVFGVVSSHPYEALMIYDYYGMNGAFVSANINVTVLVGNLQSTVNYPATTGTNLDYVLPAELTDNEYIIFPSLPIDSNRMDSYRIIALYNNTSVKILGGVTNQTTQEKFLASAGDVTDLELPAEHFHYVTGNKSFYIFKFSDASVQPQACVTSLFPNTVWRYQYDLVITSNFDRYEIFIVIIVATDAKSFITSRDRAIQKIGCENIPGTSLSGCLYKVSENGIYHIHLENYIAKFGAYLYAYNDNSATCHALGMQERSILTEFDGENYLSSRQSDTCDQDLTTAPRNPLDDVTIPSLTEVETTAVTATSPVLTTTLDTNNIIITTAISPSSLLNQPSNLTLEEAESIAQQWRDLLNVDARNTSAFKRSKMSVEDTRVSSTVIGSGGVAFLVSAGILIVCLDLLNLKKDWKSRQRKK